VEILDLKFVDAVISAINNVDDVYGVTLSKYYSPAMYMVNAKELRVPYMGEPASPK
jgi:hypothetical protein